MKKTVIRLSTVVLCLIGGIMFAACSKNERELTGEEPKLVDISEKIKINIVSEPFTEKSMSSRASVLPMSPDTIELGNGLTAEVTMQEDEEDMATRATITDGHYTIYALDAANKRITGAGKELKGTFSNGKFIRDAGSRFKLENGTYTFVCINDAMYDNGTLLLYSIDSNPMIGITPNVQISNDPTYVTFLMRHKTFRMRIRLKSYVPIPALTGEVASYSSAVSYSLNYDGTPNPLWGSSAFQLPLNFPASDVLQPGELLYTSTSNYRHLLPHSGIAPLEIRMKDGTLYGKSLSYSQTSFTNNMQLNHSYTITVKINRPGRYLYHDGSTGDWEYRGARKPIGVVLRKKTSTEQGIAIALKDTPKAHFWHPRSGAMMNTSWSSGDSEILSDMQGEYWTWNAAATKAGVVAATDVRYGPLYDAAHYDCGVNITGSNVGKWYLGSAGEWRLIYALGGGTPSDVVQFNHDYSWDDSQIDKIFTDVGGTPLGFVDATGSSGYYITSTEVGSFVTTVSRKTLPALQWMTPGGRYGEVRAFVHF